MDNIRKNKVAVFGDCIPNGSLSYVFFEDNKIKGGSRTAREYLIDRERVSILDKLNDIYDVKKFSQAYAGMSYSGCSYPKHKSDKPDTKISVVYKILNNDLSEFDVIIIFCPVGDYRITTDLGKEDDLIPDTFYGAYNLVFNELKKKYANKKIIFVLPPFIKDRKNYISFENFLSILKNKITDNNFEYISFYDHLKKFIEKPYQYVTLFPDGRHPSIDCAHYLRKYIIEQISEHVNNKYTVPKTAVCIISKQEEPYLNEWVEHYKILGFDNILFYDNNNKGDNNQYSILKPYINEGYVLYHNWQGKTGNGVQKMAYKDCILKYKEIYDWIGFFDADEFLVLNNHKTIKEFINSNINYNKYDGIYFNWLIYRDSDLIFNDGRPLLERFTEYYKSSIFKTIINTKNITYKNENINVHYPFAKKDRICNTSLKNDASKITKSARSKSIIINEAALKHFKYKTAEEYSNNIKRGDCNKRSGYNNQDYLESLLFRINDFFRVSTFTEEKLEVFLKKFPCEKNNILESLLKNKKITKEQHDKYFIK